MKKLFFILLLGLGFTQTKLDTRVYEVELNEGSEINWDLTIQYIDVESLLGFELDNAVIDIGYVDVELGVYKVEVFGTHLQDGSNGSASPCPSCPPPIGYQRG